MISYSLRISCSPQCERLLALAFLTSKENVVSIACRLVNDERKSAIRIAEALLQLPSKTASQLAVATLYQSGKQTEAK